MTIIEIMIVIIILALVVSASGYAFGALTRTQLRASCMKIAAASRWAFNRAAAQGTTIRIRFDLDTDQVSFEEAHGRVSLARTNDRRRREIERDGDEATAVDPWVAAQARLSKTIRPSFGASPFSAVEGRRYAPQRLSDRVTIERLQTPHEQRPRTSGVGHLYFFPGGFTEHAVIWLSDGSDTIFSVEVHPLTGRAVVRPERYEPRNLLDRGDGTGTSEVDP